MTTRRVTVRSTESSQVFGVARLDDGGRVTLICDARYLHMVGKAVYRGQVVGPQHGACFLSALIEEFRMATYVRAIEDPAQET